MIRFNARQMRGLTTAAMTPAHKLEPPDKPAAEPCPMPAAYMFLLIAYEG
jgi:hypothetical protein